MGTMILKGSKGTYSPVMLTPEEFGETNFTVAEDTCMECDTIRIIFNDRIDDHVSLTFMKRVTFTELHTQDY